MNGTRMDPSRGNSQKRRCPDAAYREEWERRVADSESRGSRGSKRRKGIGVKLRHCVLPFPHPLNERVQVRAMSASTTPQAGTSSRPLAQARHTALARRKEHDPVDDDDEPATDGDDPVTDDDEPSADSDDEPSVVWSSPTHGQTIAAGDSIVGAWYVCRSTTSLLLTVLGRRMRRFRRRRSVSVCPTARTTRTPTTRPVERQFIPTSPRWTLDSAPCHCA